MRITTVRVVATSMFTAFLALSSAVFGQEPLNGKVTDRHGEPRRFASVSLVGPERYLAITNAEGVFTIQKVTSGKYTVSVRQGDRVEIFTRDIPKDSLDLIVRW